MNFYITKYALTRGIIECEGAINERFTEMLIPLGAHSTFDSICKPFWHVRQEDAIEMGWEIIK